eukprot:TRINITY_DN1579_c0_g1_i3.p1 TRINITY_DN1579_c0_g1~~TRINITY_DN1579_c0_g1_i3.p1  ORF type:complete len:567 (-),score=77.69 TRINITY_DN1579_c0_g1_i3:320-2020(-)
MERESSDEEEDRENLIDQNGCKASYSTFQIGELDHRIRRHFAFNKKYLIAICHLLLAIVVFFSVDSGRLFHGVPTVRIDSRAERMRESELHALYLLRNQQLGLLNLWDRTFTHSNRDSSLIPMPNSTSNSTNSTQRRDSVSSLPSTSLEDFRSALLQQIKLNKEIQQHLLSSHRVGNVSALMDDNADGESLGFGVDACSKLDRIKRNRTIEWKPKPNRYLFAICVSGQMSNHLICLEKHMFFAALLDRVLVLPSPKFDYEYDRVIDIEHINECFGRKVVISFDEFAQVKKNKLHIGRLICYVAKPPCYLDEDHIKKLKSAGVSLGKIEAALPEDVKVDEPKKRTVEDILQRFSSSDEVLAVGELFFANVEEEWVMQPGGPLAHKCRTVIQPSRLIVLTAQRFVQTFLGGNFVAFHFRRHGFLQFCNAKKDSCFFPIPQAAECILRVVERANTPIIYLSTDAAESETDLLQSMIMVNGKQVPLVKRPSHNSVEKWDALLYRNHVGGDNQVEAMLDKTICAMSNVFIGASGSTFTEDIIRLRKDWGSASHCDEYLCQGEQPNFIADPK